MYYFYTGHKSRVDLAREGHHDLISDGGLSQNVLPTASARNTSCLLFLL